MYNPTTSPGLTRKFSKLWQGPYKVTRKLSNLNYEVIDKYGKKRVVHVNRLKEPTVPNNGCPNLNENMQGSYKERQRKIIARVKIVNTKSDHFH